MKKVISSLFAVCCLLLINTLTVKAERVYDVPSNSSFKTFMSYKTITSKNSKQYKLQEKCITDENGLRTYNGRYTIALGNYFDICVGDYVDVELSTGVVLNCVIGDVKQNCDTDSNNMQVAHNGNVVEFIVGEGLPSCVKKSGSVSSLDGFDGSVEHIIVYSEEDLNSFNFERCVISDNIILDKYSVEMPNGVIIYTVETLDGCYIVSKEDYDNVAIGDVYNIGG